MPTITDDVPLVKIPVDSDHPGKLSTLVGLFSGSQQQCPSADIGFHPKDPEQKDMVGNNT